MILFFSLAFSCLFAYITYRRFEYGLFLFFLLLPTYLIRFSLFGIPTTLLEMMFLILLGVWLLSRIPHPISQKNMMGFGLQVMGTTKQFYKNYPLLTSSIALFLLGATISIFTSVDIRTALGEWKAFYVEPVILFLILTQYVARKKEEAQHVLIHYILFPLLLCGLATSLLAIYQHFTGWMVPHAFWANRETYRVTAWYGFPNGVGLFLAPLIFLALGSWGSSFFETKTEAIRMYFYVTIATLFFIPCAILAIVYAKSTGALIGIAAGIGFLLLMSKKTRWPIIIIGAIGLICLVGIPNLKPIRDELFFQDRSGQIRLAIYGETFELLKDRPILGAGLASYEERITPYHGLVNGESIEIFHHPHNIFLTMWVNTGLIGLIGFLGILAWVCRVWYTHIQRFQVETELPASFFQSDVLIRFFITSMITVLVAGLVDSPYIKNDLAFLFWTIIALIYINTQPNRQDTPSHIQ